MQQCLFALVGASLLTAEALSVLLTVTVPRHRNICHRCRLIRVTMKGREIKRKGRQVVMLPTQLCGSWLADNLLSHSLRSPNARSSIVTPHAMQLNAHRLSASSTEILCDSAIHSPIVQSFQRRLCEKEKLNEYQEENEF